MSLNETETLKLFLVSNENFYKALCDQNYPEIDSYIMYELIFLFLKLNRKYSKILSEQDALFVEKIIDKADYFLDDEDIIVDEKRYNLDYLKNLVFKLCNYKSIGKHRDIINVDFAKHSKEENTPRIKSNNLYSFMDKLKEEQDNYYINRSNFDRTNEVNSNAMKYILETQRKFSSNLDSLILQVLSSDISSITLEELKLLYGLISFYPIAEYAINKEKISYEELHIPKSNKIDLGKTTFDNPELIELEKRFDKVDQKLKSLTEKREKILKSGVKQNIRLYNLDTEISELEHLKMEIGCELYLYPTLNNKYYNENMIKYIWKSIEQFNVEIVQGSFESMIVLFFISDQKTKFYLKTSLNLFISLINNEEMLRMFQLKNLSPNENHKKRYLKLRKA